MSPHTVLAAATLLGALPRVEVGPGVYRAIYPPTPEEAEMPVARFSLAVEPVTNVDFAIFVQANPEWQRGAVDPAFADEGYLGDWEGPTTPGAPVEANAPVTRVSWFAARAYCGAAGGRLPTEAEWELAAAASETSWDARQDPAFVQRLLTWYGTPNPPRLPPVGRSAPNRWGVRDLHGLVWEWVDDYSASLINSDTRSADGATAVRFCGAGATEASDPGDYASFMRTALRASLEARSTVRNLGFRCAWSVS